MVPDLADLHRLSRMSGSAALAHSWAMIALVGFRMRGTRMAAAVWLHSWAMKADLADMAPMVAAAGLVDSQQS